MKKFFKYLRLALNIVLAIGCFAVFNGGSTFTPNLFGIGCFVLLIAINPFGVSWMQSNNEHNEK